MADPTVTEIFEGVAALMGENPQSPDVYTSSMLRPFLSTAYQELYSLIRLWNIPVADRESSPYTVPANTTRLTPTDMGITDFGQPQKLWERGNPAEYWVEMRPADELPQAPPSTTLTWWRWRNTTFEFVGAVVARQIKIEYSTSGSCPNSGTIGFDGSYNWFVYRTASLAGRTRDEDRALQYTLDAVGKSGQADGTGGMLLALVSPMLKQTQLIPHRRLPFRPRRHSLITRPCF